MAEKETTTLEELQAQFEAEKKKITESCIKEIHEVLTKYGCKLTISGQFKDNEIKTNVVVVKV